MTDYDKCGGALWERKKKLYSKCIRCGRSLKNPETQVKGYGKVCWEKQQRSNQQTLF